MSLLRLPTLDRPSLGLSKRFTFLLTNTSNANFDAANKSLKSSHTLPSVEPLDTDEFLNMFGTQPSAMSASLSPRNHHGLPELADSPHTARFSELHSHSLSPDNRPHTSAIPPTYSNALVQTPADLDQSPIDYRSSISSSNPSTNLSLTSLRGRRNSSASSMTEEYSASDYSSRESEREGALHERLKQRSKQRRGETERASSRFSGRTTKPRFTSKSEPRLSAAADIKPRRSRKGNKKPQELDNASVDAVKPVSPESRGGRLGRAMAEGVASSPKSPPRPASHHSHARSLSRQTQTKRSSSSALRLSSAELTSNKTVTRAFSTPKVDDTDQLRFGIMCQLDDLEDLRSCSQVSPDFRQTFQKYETLLVDRVLYQQSPAAWDLRHSVRHLEKPSPFRLRSVLRDMSTVDALEDFIVWRCRSMLRYETLSALTGENPKRRAKLEEAIWTIWTFCNIFGKTSMSDATLMTQTQWLNGETTRPNSTASRAFTRSAPASMQELEDVSELWRCMETLLAGFKGQEEDARRIGLFDSVGKTTATDTELLNAWISDVLSLGPKAVLTLSSCDFEQAKVLGVTRWTPPSKGKSRNNFLKTAVEEVYRERLMMEAKRKAANFRKSMKATHSRSRSDPPVDIAWALTQPQSPRQVQKPFPVSTGVEVRRSMPHPIRTIQLRDQNRNRPDCDSLSPFSAYPTPILSPASNPMAFSPLALTKNASAKLGANLFPIKTQDQARRHSIPTASANIPSETLPDLEVVDPVDRAVFLLVNEMSFSEADAKRALALSDTGAGINVQRAIQILSRNEEVPMQTKRTHISELPAAIGNAQLAAKIIQPEYCEGLCKTTMVVEPRKDRVSGLDLVKRGMSYRMSFRKPTRLSVIMDNEESGTSNGMPARIADNGMTRLGGGWAISKTASDRISAPPISNSVAFLPNMNLGTLRHSLPPTPPDEPNEYAWLTPDNNPLSESEAPKPRVTLTRVGTGINKRGWSLTGTKRKDRVVQPEIIGYVY